MRLLREDQVLTQARTPARSVPGAVRVLTVVLLVVLLTVVLGSAFSGSTTPPQLLDPGPVVRWGQPIAAAVAQLSGILTIGALAVCAFCGPAPRTSRVWTSSLQWAAAAGLCWTTAHAIHLVLTFLDISGLPLTALATTPALADFIVGTSVGSLLGIATVLSGAVAVVCTVARGYRAVVTALGLAVLALLPVGASGHAASSGDHHAAVSGMWLHLTAVSIWAGGIMVVLTLALAQRIENTEMGPLAERFSRMAGWCFAAVVAAGLFSAFLRIENLPADLTGTRWGQLLLVKIVLTALLGVAGSLHRRSTMPALRQGRSAAFLRLLTVEALVLGALVGISVALGRSAHPPTAATQIGTGLPEPYWPAVLNQWSLDPALTLLPAVAALLYLSWVRRLTRRGDTWPRHRTVLMMIGLGSFWWITNGALAAYGHYLFSAHIAAHMLVVMLVPVFLTLGAPVTLALRALPVRGDGTRGPREWLLTVLHSRPAQFLAHPLTAAVHVVLAMAVFYTTGLFELSLRFELIHVLSMLHFTAAGYLLINVLIGSDPGPTRPMYPLRLPLLLPSMVFHTFFGLFMLAGSGQLAEVHDRAVDAPWQVDRVADQQMAGALFWALGEIPAIGLAVVIAGLWISSDERQQRNTVRRASAAPQGQNSAL